MRLLTIFAAVLATLTSFDIALVGSASLLEAIWVLVNVSGAWYSYQSWRDAEASRVAALAPPIDIPAVTIAEMSAFIQKHITIIQIGFGILGVMAWFVPPPQDPSNVRVIIVLGLVSLAFELTYKSFRVRGYRHKALEQMKEERYGQTHTPPDGEGPGTYLGGVDSATEREQRTEWQA